MRCLLFVMLLLSCRTANFFSSLENAQTIEEFAAKAIEEKRFSDALNKLRSLLPLEKRSLLASGEVSPRNHQELIREYFSRQRNYITLVTLYSIAYIGDAGINYLKLLQKVTTIQVVDINQILFKMMTEIQTSEATGVTMQTAVLLRNLIPEGEKKASDVITDLILSLIGVAISLMNLDIDHDKAISAEEIKLLTDADGDVIFSSCNTMLELSESLIKKDSNKNYLLLNSRLKAFNADINAVEAITTSEKVRQFFSDMIKAKGTLSFSAISDEAYISLKEDTRFPPKSVLNIPRRNELEAKIKLYRELVVLDDNGWIKDTKCDGLLFNSLYNLSGGNIDISKAVDADGAWHRYPSKDCLEKGESASSMSRDMLLGLLLWAYYNKRLDIVQGIVAYSENHRDKNGFWVLGKGDIAATLVNPELENTVMMLLNVLAGSTPEQRDRTWVVNQGYEIHTQLLDLLLTADIFGGITEGELNLLKFYSSKEPNNAFFSALLHRYLDGDMSVAVDILLNSRWFPEKTLPSTEQRCEFYLWQREQNTKGGESESWKPCPATKASFTGVDFFFAASLVLCSMPEDCKNTSI